MAVIKIAGGPCHDLGFHRGGPTFFDGEWNHIPALFTAHDFAFRFGRRAPGQRGRILDEATAEDYTTPTRPTCDRERV